MSRRHYFPEGFICGIIMYFCRWTRWSRMSLWPREISFIFCFVQKWDLLRNSHISITVSNAREIIVEKFSISCWNIKFYLLPAATKLWPRLFFYTCLWFCSRGGGLWGEDCSIRSMSGRYAFYWNAFLFSEWLVKGNALILKMDRIAIDYFLE